MQILSIQAVFTDEGLRGIVVTTGGLGDAHRSFPYMGPGGQSEDLGGQMALITLGGVDVSDLRNVGVWLSEAGHVLHVTFAISIGCIFSLGVVRILNVPTKLSDLSLNWLTSLLSCSLKRQSDLREKEKAGGLVDRHPDSAVALLARDWLKVLHGQVVL